MCRATPGGSNRVYQVPIDSWTSVIDGAPPIASMRPDRKSTRLNSSHLVSSYAVFCLKKRTEDMENTWHPEIVQTYSTHWQGTLGETAGCSQDGRDHPYEPGTSSPFSTTVELESWTRS